MARTTRRTRAARPPAAGGESDSNTNSTTNNTNTDTLAVFALVPAQANDGFINYSTTQGQRLFNDTVKNLYEETSEMFSCDAGGLLDFLSRVEDRASLTGMTQVFNIPDGNTPSTKIHFLRNHGVVTLAMIKAHATTYTGTPTRLAQDNRALYHMLMNSLSATGRAKITPHQLDYTDGDNRHGVALLKIIIGVSGIDTQATVSHLRAQLTGLADYMTKVDSDVLKFNQHVQTLLIELHNRRQVTNDLFIHLMNGYKACADHRFVEYIIRKEEEYEEDAKITPDDLMKRAANKYKILVQKGVWRAPSPAESKIIALEAKIEQYKRDARKRKPTAPAGKEKDQKRPRTPKDTKKKLQVEPWMEKPPTASERGRPKTVKDKEYWWCTPLKRWCRHHPRDCRHGDKKGLADIKAAAADQAGGDTKAQQARRLQFTKALQAATTIKADETDEE